MGRSKTAPKRRRIESTQDAFNSTVKSKSRIESLDEQQKALKILKNVPQEMVEKAAADAMRINLPYWDSSLFTIRPKDNDDPSIHLSTKFPGLALHTKIPTDDFLLLQKLHDLIKLKSQHSMTSWSGSKSDPRRRAFGFLPDTLGYREDIRSTFLDISTPGKSPDDNAIKQGLDNISNAKDKNDTIEEEKERNKQASVLLSKEEIPKGLYRALDGLLTYFQSCLKARKSEKNDSDNINLCQYLTRSNLIAAQPNLHCGRHLLPAHVDHPKKDGFGILILTIAIRGGGATIFVENNNQTQKGTFRLMEGQGYMLSGYVRNACTHGVLADDTCKPENKTTIEDNIENEKGGRLKGSPIGGAYRESLNLRFGLHGWSRSDPSPADVLKYWGASF